MHRRASPNPSVNASSSLPTELKRANPKELRPGIGAGHHHQIIQNPRASGHHNRSHNQGTTSTPIQGTTWSRIKKSTYISTATIGALPIKQKHPNKQNNRPYKAWASTHIQLPGPEGSAIESWKGQTYSKPILIKMRPNNTSYNLCQIGQIQTHAS